MKLDFAFNLGPTPAEAVVILKQQYAAARARTSDDAEFSVEACPDGACRYCGQGRSPLSQRSHLDGHSRCTVDAQFVDELRRSIMCRSDITFAMVAEALGLTVICIRMLVHKGARRRKAA